MTKGCKSKRLGPGVNDDLLRRDFTAPGPNRKWARDVTEHPTSESKIYGCAIKDLFSNRIVGHAVSYRMVADLAVTSFLTALAGREPNDGVIFHADQRSQFCVCRFRAVLKAAEHQGSMDRAAYAGDNAAMGSFLALLRRRVLNNGPWCTRAAPHDHLLDQMHPQPPAASTHPRKTHLGQVRASLHQHHH